MAIKIYEKFAPRANPSDGDHPYGSIKNESVPGAKDGTPLDAVWGNDMVGFTDALLAEAGITPSGNPDTAVTSQRLEALKVLIPKIGDTIYNRSFNGVDQMLSYSGHEIGLKYSTGGTVWEVKTISDPMTLSDFTALNAICIRDFGAVSDYEGDPNYDGFDDDIITATDNTVAFQYCLDNAPVTNGELTLFVGDGHFGIKAGSITCDNTRFNKLKIVGVSKEVSVIDFIKEDTTGLEYTKPDDANFAFVFSGVDVYWINITCKCTTDMAPIGGNVYGGAVWFARYLECDTVYFSHAKTSHCNYRGHSIEGDAFGIKTRVVLDYSYGENVGGSGYWLENTRSLDVTGGAYKRNGFFGETGTGYGIAASHGCDNITLHGVLFQENYRKGFDRHGGVGFLSVSNCSFIDNILYDIYDNRLELENDYVGAQSNVTTLDNCSFVINANVDFVEECIIAIQGKANANKSFIGLYDTNNASQTSGVTKQINVTNSSFSCPNELPTKFDGLNLFAANAVVVEFDNCPMRLDNLLSKTDATVYGAQIFTTEGGANPFLFRVINSSLNFGNGAHNNGSNDWNTPIFSLNSPVASDCKLEVDSCEIQMANHVLLASVSSNQHFQSSVQRKFSNCRFRVLDIALNMNGAGVVDNAFKWIPTKYMFGSEAGHNGNKFWIGDMKGYYTNHIGANIDATESIGLDIPMSFKTIGSQIKIYTGAMSGECAISMIGAGSLYSKNAASWVNSSTALSASLTNTDYSIAGFSDEVITHNGSPTNFNAKVFTISMTTAKSNTALTRAEMMFSQKQFLGVVGIS